MGLPKKITRQITENLAKIKNIPTIMLSFVS
jgi:hypothetical protein